MNFLQMQILFLNIFVSAINGDKKEYDPSSVFIGKELKVLEISSTCPLKKMSKNSIHSLWLQNQTSNATVVCALKFLEENLEQSFVWSILGHTMDKRSQKQQADFCFKQAIKLSGKYSQFVKEWHFIGPFGIGKSEFDGSPLAAYGGIGNASRFRYNSKPHPSYFSELVPGGLVKWSVIKQIQNHEMIQIKPNVDWNDLVSSLGSLGITEWQGWAVGDFFTNENNIQLSFQCHGVTRCFVGDNLIVGDVYHRDQLWFPVTLPRGHHSVVILLRTKVSAKFKFSVSQRPKFVALDPPFSPDIYKGYLPRKSYLSVPVSNLMAKKWLKIINVKLVDQSIGQTLVPALDRSVGIYDIAPGQTRPVAVQLGSEQATEDLKFHECKNVEIELKFITSEGAENLKFVLRCRSQGSSFLLTFMDHDGSVQQAAAIEPLDTCRNNICPVVLTLHGTTVPPQNQADSYKKMLQGDFQFGVKSMWLLAPTRHGAHNWEGPGTLTAMSALKTLHELTAQSDCFKLKADSTKVLFAGHSMGGHGAWHLASHFPDHAVGLISLAGWIKKEEYGESNLFFRHDISTSYTDPAVKAVMEASIGENDADKHVTNLKGIPILARIGEKDRTVHPYYVRRMIRLLKDAGITATYSELPGLEHWWWDTKETNDGGCMNDAQIRKFMQEVVNTLQSDKLETCTSEATDCEAQSSDRYKNPDQEALTLTTINPALGEGLRGVAVFQQIIPFRISTIHIAVNGTILTLTTQNVKCLQITNIVPKKGIIYQSIDSFIIDSYTVELKKQGFPYIFCRSTSQNIPKWNQIEDFQSQQPHLSRSPKTYGPARRVAEREFVIVVGSRGDQSASEVLLRHAVYIANQFFLTSDTIVPIVEDKNFNVSSEANLIIIGNPEEHLLTSKYLDYLPDLTYITSSDQASPRLQLGTLCTFQLPRTGVLTLAPNGKGGLVLLLMGLSSQGLEDIVSLATPTIPPMARSPFSNLLPDFIITGPDMEHKGPGGFLCAGFWDNSWKYLSPSSSCVCMDSLSL